jgi:hypothetical protein
MSRCHGEPDACPLKKTYDGAWKECADCRNRLREIETELINLRSEHRTLAQRIQNAVPKKRGACHGYR